MQIEDFPVELSPVPGAMPVWRGEVGEAQWRSLAQQVRAKGGRMVALWGSDQTDRAPAATNRRGFEIHMALTVRSGLVWLTLPVAPERAEFPDVADVFPSANRMQRAAYDLLGVRAIGAGDQRQWLRHATWRPQEFPLRKSFDGASAYPGQPDDYPFVRVAGEGVHEIPVGPVHAGIIEPGHFRFSVVGERVLRLEERLAYTHKGIEKRFESMSIAQGVRLAGRVSGDSTAAYAWAYCMAAEGAAFFTPPERAQWLRALWLERERIANHLGDLGFLGNDAGLAFGLAQFSRLKEDLLRLNRELSGHRYLMDAIVPGGVAQDLDGAAVSALRAQIAALRAEVRELKVVYDEHPGLQDRFIAAGRVAPELADRLGLCGLAGRASGMSWDLRVQFPAVPYDALDVRMATHRNGDVAARVTLRFEEILESLDLCSVILERLPRGEIRTDLPVPLENSVGLGWVEGWRGEVLVALEAGRDGSLRRVHPHDPSWHNWPVLEHAVMNNIVPDFPLINKSFNSSYSGVDL
jgi:Ni,Fe-hydrogenase III large subunit/Ni,Fe-hydrogenase III component G